MNARRGFLRGGLCLLAAGCSTAPSRVHSEGPLQLDLSSATAPPAPAPFAAFADQRPAEQRSRQRHSRGEQYGDADFTMPSADAVRAEFAQQVGPQGLQRALAAKLAAAQVVLEDFQLGWFASAESTAGSYQPPGFAAMDALMYSAFGGKGVMLGRLRLRIDAIPYAATYGMDAAGAPPPLRHSYVSVVETLVRRVLQQVAAAR
jgi:hypothetical protein